MTDAPGRIRVKAMLIAVHDDGTAHAVTSNPPTREHPDGFHRLIGGSVEFGESHREAIVREVGEELGAAIVGLRYVGVLENVFRMNGSTGHEIVFVYTGRLDPAPADVDAVLVESDGSAVPVVWRPIDDRDEPVPVFPAGIESMLSLASAYSASSTRA